MKIESILLIIIISILSLAVFCMFFSYVCTIPGLERQEVYPLKEPVITDI